MINDNRMQLTYILKKKLMIVLVSYEMWKETPQFGTTMCAKDSISKIKDLSSLKCLKEMKDTWFS